MHFTFSDMIAGYIEHYDWDKRTFTIKTVDGREFEVLLSDNVYAEMVRNLGEGYIDSTEQIKDMIDDKGRYVFVYGIFYHEQGDFHFEAKHIVFLGKEEQEFRFEKQDWWIQQIKQLADFYLKAQFDNGEVDYSKYRTSLTLEGTKMDTIRQETDTISRMVYGFSSAYMLTGDERYLETAEKGAQYLREHFRCVDSQEDTVYWYHAVDYLGDNRYKKIFASEFGDDYDAIPAYEQIYALAGLTQMYRITGNPDVLKDIERTVNLFQKYFLDKEAGGYWSHIDPIRFSGTSELLGRDRARKNWNSCGDHTPAYLINLYLATGEEKYKDMLKYTADIIVNHFPDYENSPFVQEKYHADWSKDTTWGWQQNHAVVGHNLKIAWNLMRVQNVIQDEKYVEMAEKIAELMPKYGMDLQRGGWYDVVDRVRQDGQEFNHYAWHDRKAWWQQEQGILAYYILAGVLQKEEYLKTARESAAFYNAWFPDHDSGAVYFNVLANGIPYLLGTERLKASHSMSGYHSFELAYLCSVYINLLVSKKHLDLYFKPSPSSLKDNVLRIQPDILPKASVVIDRVWVEGKEYTDFDSDEMTVHLPNEAGRITVKVRLISVSDQDEFYLFVDQDENGTNVIMKGILGAEGLDQFVDAVQDIIKSSPKQIMFDMKQLKSMNTQAVRALAFERQKTSAGIVIIGVNEEIKNALEAEELTEGVTFIE